MNEKPFMPDPDLENLQEKAHVCPPPPPHDCSCEQTPVVVERIKKPFLNPDGSFSHRYYYQYPVTNFSAVHEGNSIHSPNLAEVLHRFKHHLAHKQPMIENGNTDTILTRSIQDGKLGELTKIDYVNPERRSKVHVPSEHALLNAMDSQAVNYKGLVDKESVRATTAEEAIEEAVHQEILRAKAAEGELGERITELAGDVVHTDLVGEDGTIIKDVSLDMENLSRVTFTTAKVSLEDGSSDTDTKFFDLMVPITEMTNDKIREFGETLNFIDPEIFDNVDDSTVVKAEFKPGEGNTIGRLSVTRKNIKGAGDDTTVHVAIKSDAMTKTVNDVSESEEEIILAPKMADTSELLDQIRALYA